MSNPTTDPGVRGTLNPVQDDIIYREVLLDKTRVEAVRPFDQVKSDAGGQPIRLVVDAVGCRHIMQGNHRVFGTQLDGITRVEALFYTPEEWEAFTGLPFLSGGTGTPGVVV